MVRKEKKPEIVDRVKEKLDRAEIVIVTDYRGLTVADMTNLRQRLRQHGIEYHVVKNTLAGFAANAAGKPGLTQYLEGPTAIAFGYGDVVQPAKTLQEYLKATDTPFKIKGGILGDRPVTPEEIAAIAKLPPREELIAKVVGLLQSPMSRFVNVLNANLQGLVVVLQGRVKQLEEGG